MLLLPCTRMAKRCSFVRPSVDVGCMSEPQASPRYTFDRVVRMVLSALVLIGLFWLMRYLSDVLIPFAVAVVLAYLLNPLVNLFEERTGRRSLAVAIVIGGLGILAMATAVLVLPLAYQQMARFGRDLDLLRNDLGAAFRSAPVPPNETGGPLLSPTGASGGDEGITAGMATVELKSVVGWRELMEGWRLYHEVEGPMLRSERFALLRERIAGTYIGELLDAALRYVNSEEFTKKLLDMTGRLVRGGWSVVTFALNLVLGLTVLILVLLYLVFLLLDYRDFANSWKTFLPPQYRDSIVEFLVEFDDALRRYLRGQSVVSLLYAAFLSLGFWLIGLPLAVPVGLLIGVLSIVPYLQALGLIPAMFLAVMRSIEGDHSFIGSISLTLLVFGGVQMLQDWLITPRIMGRATGLRPVAVLLGVFIWGKLLGFLGLLLAIPLTCLGIAYYRRYVLRVTESEETGSKNASVPPAAAS